MKPKTPNNHPDLFRSQLSQIINLSHPLCRLSDKINWQRLETNIEEIYGHGCGQPPLPTRLLAGLHYLKYTFIPKGHKFHGKVRSRTLKKCNPPINNRS